MQGWNDPPTLSYDRHHNTTKRKNNLNQYVQHALNEGETPQTKHQAVSDIELLKSKSTKQDEGVEKTVETEETKKEEEEKLDWIQVLTNLSEKCSAATSKTVLKKLQVAGKMQKEGKFGGKLEAAMSKMAGKLRDCEFEEAGKMHVAIMCDHTAEVRQWMIGVKKLMEELKKQQNT